MIVLYSFARSSQPATVLAPTVNLLELSVEVPLNNTQRVKWHRQSQQPVRRSHRAIRDALFVGDRL